MNDKDDDCGSYGSSSSGHGESSHYSETSRSSSHYSDGMRSQQRGLRVPTYAGSGGVVRSSVTPRDYQGCAPSPPDASYASSSSASSVSTSSTDDHSHERYQNQHEKPVSNNRMRSPELQRRRVRTGVEEEMSPSSSSSSSGDHSSSYSDSDSGSDGDSASDEDSVESVFMDEESSVVVRSGNPDVHKGKHFGNKLKGKIKIPIISSKLRSMIPSNITWNAVNRNDDGNVVFFGRTMPMVTRKNDEESRRRSREIVDSPKSASASMVYPSVDVKRVYEDFDFAIMLSTDEDYEYWSNVLNFFSETQEGNDGFDENENNFVSAGRGDHSRSIMHNEDGVSCYKITSECVYRPSIFERVVAQDLNNDCEEEVLESVIEDSASCCTPNHRTTPATSLSTKRRMSHVLMQRGSSLRSVATDGNALMSPCSTPKRLFKPEDLPNSASKTPGEKNDRRYAGSNAVPRGIAARAKMGEIEVFLQAMSHGFVVKRHRPKAAPTFVKLFSDDGGDTINYRMISEDEAVVALNEQRMRYNQNIAGDENYRCKDCCSDELEPFARKNRRHLPSNLPDHLVVEQYREDVHHSRGSIGQNIKTAIRSNWDRFESSGSIRAADIVDVHPAKKLDPFYSKHPSYTVKSTVSLRESPASFSPCNTFSLVSPSLMLTKGKNTAAASDEYICSKWYNGRGNPKSFNYLNFETATEGEFWVILRGFLMLHRDAASHRFAADRASGIGSHFARITRQQQLNEQEAKEKENNKSNNSNTATAAWNYVLNTPVTAAGAVRGVGEAVSSSLRKRRNRNRGIDDDIPNIERQRAITGTGTNSLDESDFESDDESNEMPPTIAEHLHVARDFVVANALLLANKTQAAVEKAKAVNNDATLDPAATHPPPPSDYFLGFSSAGTKIWARLRQAGLETQRVHGLDRKRVMLLVRCPEDRLQDVAEVIRLKLRTKDGLFLPFRESHSHIFLHNSEMSENADPEEKPINTGPNDSLFRSADRQFIINFILQSKLHDTGADLGPSNSLGKHISSHVPLHNRGRLEDLFYVWVYFWKVENWINRDGKSMSCDKDEDLQQNPTDVNNFSTRFFTGAFHQPLDSIEQYYGSNVAFYFAWLQHVARYLVPLSLIGIIVFIAQVQNNSWDHWTRIPFSIIIMLWSFAVMVTWRKRSNYLAYRWGTLNYEEEETTRPQFNANYKRMPDPKNPKESVFVRDPITNELVYNNPWWKRLLTFSISFPLMIGVTFGLLVSILIFNANRDILIARYFDEETGDGDQFTWDFSIGVIRQASTGDAVDVTSEHMSDAYFWLIMLGLPLLLGICFPLLNYIFTRVAVFLNDIENYKTETEYRNFLVMKVFAFRFVCYFGTLYYYAFMASGTSERGDDGYLASENAILRVAASLIIFVTVAHWWMVLTTVYLPLLIHQFMLTRNEKRYRDVQHDLHRQEYILPHNRRTFSENSGDNDEEDVENRYSQGEKDSSNQMKRLRNENLLLSQAMHPVWSEVNLPAYNSFADYVYAVIMFAYVTCFSVLLPITPVFILINTLLSMRIDAYKLCRGRKRPLTVKSGGIGVWEHVLHIVTVIAVLTNCALMAVTSNFFGWIHEEIGPVGVALICIGWEHIMLLIKYILQSASKKLPQSVIDAMKMEKVRASQRRNEYLVNRHRRSRGDVFRADDDSRSKIINAGLLSPPPSDIGPRTPRQGLSTILSSDETDDHHSENGSEKVMRSSPVVPKPVPEKEFEVGNPRQTSMASIYSNESVDGSENKENNCSRSVRSKATYNSRRSKSSRYSAGDNSENTEPAKCVLTNGAASIHTADSRSSDGRTVKSIIHQFERQKSCKSFQHLSENKNKAAKQSEISNELTPVEMLAMKKTRLTPPRTNLTSFHHPESPSPTPRNLFADALMEQENYSKAEESFGRYNSRPSAPPKPPTPECHSVGKNISYSSNRSKNGTQDETVYSRHRMSVGNRSGDSTYSQEDSSFDSSEEESSEGSVSTGEESSETCQTQRSDVTSNCARRVLDFQETTAHEIVDDNNNKTANTNEPESVLEVSETHHDSSASGLNNCVDRKSILGARPRESNIFKSASEASTVYSFGSGSEQSSAIRRRNQQNKTPSGKHGSHANISFNRMTRPPVRSGNVWR